jgi:hypothetical protein
MEIERLNYSQRFLYTQAISIVTPVYKGMTLTLFGYVYMIN